MSIDTVAVIGGSGRIGSTIVDDLADNGYRTVNVDRERGDADQFVRADALDAGETYGALAMTDADAVIHMGTIPRAGGTPDHVTFESNALASYHVLEAANALGLEAACLASSINALGWSYQDVPPELHYLPLDEDHPTTPRDPYALGKRVTEELCDGFGRLDAPQTIATLRFPWVASTEALRERYVEGDRSLESLRASWNPDAPTDDAFSYVHVKDAARIARRTIEADYTGHETFFVSAADTNADVPTERLIEEFHPDLEVRGSFEGHEALIDTSKARELLGWEPERSWRDL